jgi:hypothetical protein
MHPTEALGLGALAISTFLTGSALLARTGHISPDFTGPQWPFLYCYGKPANKRRLQEIQRCLADIDQAERDRDERG